MSDPKKSRPRKDKRSQTIKDAEAALNSAIVRGESSEKIEDLRRILDDLSHPSRSDMS